MKQRHSARRTIRRALARLTVGVAATAVLATPVLADTTYRIDRTIGGGSVVGTIVTDGKSGVLTAQDIVSWNLTLNGVGASTVLTSAGQTSLPRVDGSDLVASGRNLTFNFSANDDGLFSFQANPGIASGTKYWCNATAAGACAKGESVIPQAYNDPSAQYVDTTGVQVLGVGGPLQAQNEIIQSLLLLATARRAQMITNNLFSSILLGFNEQVSCSDCGGADAMFGSFNVGAHGRHSLTPELTLVGGVSIGKYNERGADVALTATAALGLRYDPANMGPSRPFVEIGGAATPYQKTNYARPYTYDSGASFGIGQGSTRTSIWNLYGRVGWVDRVTKRDEVAVSASISQTWQKVRQYGEGDGSDPMDFAFDSGTDRMTVVGVVGQYTHLFGLRVEMGLTGGIQRSIYSKSGIKAELPDGSLSMSGSPGATWAVFGGRIGIRLNPRVTVDAIVDGTSGHGIGTSIHGGFGFRMNL